MLRPQERKHVVRRLSMRLSMRMEKQHEMEDRWRALFARRWMEYILGYVIPNANLMDALRDGTHLCRLLNVLRPGTVHRVVEQVEMKQVQRLENITNFLAGCETMGVRTINLFRPQDLLDGHAPSVVVHCILCVADQSSALREDHEEIMLVIGDQVDRELNMGVVKETVGIVREEEARDSARTPRLSARGPREEEPPLSSVRSGADAFARSGGDTARSERLVSVREEVEPAEMEKRVDAEPNDKEVEGEEEEEDPFSEGWRIRLEEARRGMRALSEEDWKRLESRVAMLEGEDRALRKRIEMLHRVNSDLVTAFRVRSATLDEEISEFRQDPQTVIGDNENWSDDVASLKKSDTSLAKEIDSFIHDERELFHASFRQERTSMEQQSTEIEMHIDTLKGMRQAMEAITTHFEHVIDGEGQAGDVEEMVQQMEHLLNELRRFERQVLVTSHRSAPLGLL